MKSWAIQDAIAAALTADATLAGLVTGVFDDVPDGQVTPYVEIVDQTDSPDDLLVETGNSATITLQIWDDQPTFSRVKPAADRVVEVLHENSLIVVGGVPAVRVRMEMFNTLKDDLWRRGILRFRVDLFGS